MKSYSLDHLAQSILHRDSLTFHRNESSAMAMAIAHVGEIDARRSYRDEGYPSMLAFCEQMYELSEAAALKRIRVARLAREYPALFEALAERKLSLSCVIMLSPYLNASNADQLIAAAAHAPKSELEPLIAKWFPKQDVAAKLEAVPEPPPMLGDQRSPGSPDCAADDQSCPQTTGAAIDDQLSAQAVDDQLRSDADEKPMPRPKVSPLSEDRFLLQLTIGRSTHDKLRYAQALLSHQLPSGDLVGVFDRALDALIVQLEKRKFAATSRSRRAGQSSTKSPRHIPAHVKREVWVRDGGQCTFVSEAGHRCCARELLEFDHVEAVALGGKATVAGMRLRCRTHNQLEAERTFGAEFMRAKREEARRVARENKAKKERDAETARLQKQARNAAERQATEARNADYQREAETSVNASAEQRAAEAQLAAAAAERSKALDVVPWLRTLGYRLDEARRAAAHCESVPDASLGERVRMALAFLAPRATRQDFRSGAHREGAPA